jgi:hypothetical protein
MPIVARCPAHSRDEALTSRGIPGRAAQADPGQNDDALSKDRRQVTVGNLEKRLPCDPEMIDLFFIVDVAGRVGISLRTYKKFIVGDAYGLTPPGRSRAA